MQKTIHTQQPAIHIEPAVGGVNLFVPIEPEVLVGHRCQDLLLRMQQALLTYLAMTAAERLPIIV